ncbi:MAG TPA: GntG family PLP-dependent aldolase [Acidimicrobiia bacterium]|nr:GntG family PLP-dependent aldolase [Acidimicrobiia bacterium]
MASPDGRIDLRSDTVTTPTPEMRRAMADAEVGDDVYGEDPTIKRFQERAAELLGTEAALYVPSGTMANQLALRVLARPGTEVLCAARAHVFRYEAAAAAWNSAVQLHPFPDGDGLIDAGALDETIEDSGHHSPSVSLIAIENTHMPSCGRPWRVDEVARVGDVGANHGIAIYCDGARIWNAAVALGVRARDLVAPAAAVMFCVSKGLSAPVGSVLCGPADLIGEAREHRQRLGGAMRQAGVIAAAGLVALDSMIERLADDHRRARRLAEAVAERWPGSVAPEIVETNMVCAAADRLPRDLLTRLAGEGIRAGTIDTRTVRFATHKDVDDADIERVLKTLAGIAGQ